VVAVSAIAVVLLDCIKVEVSCENCHLCRVKGIAKNLAGLIVSLGSQTNLELLVVEVETELLSNSVIVPSGLPSKQPNS